MSYSSNKEVGTGSCKVSFLGNYKGRAAVTGNTFQIIPAPFTVKAEAADMVYHDTGKYCSEPYVSIGGRPVDKKNYTVKWKDGTGDNAREMKEGQTLTLGENETWREMTVTVTGKGNYEETSVSTTYRVKRLPEASADLSKAKIVAKGTKNSVASQGYKGCPLEPEIDVLIGSGGSQTVLDPAEYTVRYINNTGMGKATTLVTGNGEKAVGSVSTTFGIRPRSLLELLLDKLV